jgi:hypothetical protein
MRANEWKDDTHYNTVNVWDRNDRDYIESEIKVGDGSFRWTHSRELLSGRQGDTNYVVDLHASDFSRLAKKSEKPE